jgi:hypothetical protein
MIRNPHRSNPNISKGKPSKTVKGNWIDIFNPTRDYINPEEAAGLTNPWLCFFNPSPISLGEIPRRF